MFSVDHGQHIKLMGFGEFDNCMTNGVRFYGSRRALIIAKFFG